MKNDLRCLAAVFLGIVATSSGCSFLQPQVDLSRYYTLTAVAEGDAAASRSESSAPCPLYGVGPITLPAYLDRNEIAQRVSATELSYSSTERWAEPLRAGFAGALVENLARLLGTDCVIEFPWPPGVEVDYQVDVEVRRFERLADGESLLAARWRIAKKGGGGPVTMRDSSLTDRGGRGSAEGVAALSRLVAALSREIATALRQLPPAPRAQ